VTREPKVRDLMTRDICGVSEDATLLTAATAMAEQRVNSLVVWPTAAEEPFGILTSSDLIDAIAAAKLRFREAYAEASRGVIDAVAAAELHKVWRKFTETPR